MSLFTGRTTTRVNTEDAHGALSHNRAHALGQQVQGSFRSLGDSGERLPVPKKCRMAKVRAKEGQNPKWVRCDLGDIFNNKSLQKLMEDILYRHEVTFLEDNSVASLRYEFPDFGASRLQPTALKHVCTELGRYLERAAVTSVTNIPSVIIIQRRVIVWERVREAFMAEFYSDDALLRVFAEFGEGKGKEEKGKKEEMSKVEQSSEKLSGSEVLVDVGVKAGLSVVFSLLKQTWVQLAWQKQVEEQMKVSGAVVPFAGVNLPNEVLRSVLDVMKSIPLTSCLQQASEF